MMPFDQGGAGESVYFKGFGNSNSKLVYIDNLQRAATYWGTPANDFSQGSGGMGNLAPPSALMIDGPASTDFAIGLPPRGTPGQDNGAVIRVACNDPAAPCANNADHQYTVLDLDDNLRNGVSLQLQYNPTNNQLLVAGSGGAGGKLGLAVPQFLTSGGNCESMSSPAACGSAVIGQVQMAAGATTLVINTAKVTPSSRFWFSFSTVGIAAPTNIGKLLQPYVSAISGGTSFTITLPVAPETNPIRINFGFADNN
jgi:hypothetical protein